MGKSLHQEQWAEQSWARGAAHFLTPNPGDDVTAVLKIPPTLALVFSLVCFSQSAIAATLTVELEGLEEPMLSNTRDFLSIMEYQPGRLATVTERIVRRLHKRAPDEIREALQPFGYYKPVIRASLEKKDDDWLARYEVDPGPATLLREVHVEVKGDGASEPALKEARASIDLTAGQRLDHRAYEDAKSRLLDVSYSGGYLDVRYERSEMRVYPEQQQADIYLILDTGPRYYFGPVVVEQGILNPEFVQKYIPIKPGDPFDADKLIELQLSLTDSEYFSQVEVDVQRENAEDFHIPIRVSTQPRKRRRYTLGLGFGTDTGPRANIGAEFRRLNRRGHRFRSDLRISEIKTTVSSQYQIPIRNVRTDRATIFGNLQQAEVGDADTEQFAVGLSRDEGWLGFRRRFYGEARREDFSFGDGPTLRTDLGIVGGTLSRKVVDELMFPSRGFSFSLDVHGAAEGVLSDASFVQGVATGSVLRPLGAKGRLVFRADIGRTLTDTFDVLPPSERFFAGGDRSVRGYSFESLGPRDADGNVIGGDTLLVGSVEANYFFKGRFGGAIFFDIGNAANGVPDDLKAGAGLGVRFRSPIGMVRLDFAHPFDDPDKDFRIHFSIGPDL